MTEHRPGNIENPFKDDMTGRVLLGRYRIVRRLAAGGMGVVYLARTEGARGFVKPVVVKLILPTFSSDESFLKMFVREAQILSKLNDPGIVSVIDFEQEKNFYIMVLEYVHGFQLREWLKYREYKRKPLPTDIIINIVLKVLEPLHHAHTVKNEDGHILGVVHQDISPSNILINTDGRVKLVDFGIARMVEGSEEGATTTGKGGFQGKLSYSAPERFSGKPATIRCDLYSVGVVLHQLLIGKNEFYAKSHANTIAQVLHHRPSSVTLRRPDAPPALDKVIQKSLAKNPEYRFETALEFADALRPFLGSDSHILDEQMAEMVAEDFSDEMANFLEVEPLGLREKAWRKPSVTPPPSEDVAESTRRITGREMEELLDSHSPFLDMAEDIQSGFPEETVSLKPAAHTPSDDIHAIPHDRDDSDPTPFPSASVADSVAESRSSTPRMVSVKGLIAIVATVLLAAVGVFFLLTRTPAGPQKKIVLVQSTVATTPDSVSPRTADSAGNNAPDARVKPSLPGTETQKATNDETAKVSEPVDSKRNRRPRGKELSPEQKQLLQLTTAFKKQKNRVRNCLNNHSETLENIKQVSFIFTVSKDGAVQKVGLQPASITGTKLGSCVRQVAQSTRFPKQQSAITFTIPVRVKQ